MTSLRSTLYRFLRWSEQYTNTDMVYLAHSGFWMNLGSVTVSLFALALYIIFAHTLSPEVYGTYQYFISAAAVIGALTLTGANTAVIRATARGEDGSLRRSIRVQLAWGVLPLLVSLLCATYYLHSGNELLAIGFALIGVFVPVNNALNTYSAFLAGKKDFKRAFQYNFATNLFYYGALALVALRVPSALALIAANLLVQCIALFLAYRMTLRTYRPSNEWSEETVIYGKHLSLMGAVGAAAQQVDNLMVFHFLGPSSLALYSFATAIPDRLASLLKFVPFSLLPRFASQDEERAREEISWRNLLWVFFIILLIGLLYVALAPLIFKYLFPAYANAVPYSRFYALTMFAVIGYIFSAALMAHRRIHELYLSSTVVPVVQVLLQLAGILLWGLWGLVFGKVLGSFVLIIFSAVLVRTVKK